MNDDEQPQPSQPNRIAPGKAPQATTSSSRRIVTLPYTKSDEDILEDRGIRLYKKIGEGTHSKVYLAQYISKSDPDAKLTMACKVIKISELTQGLADKFLVRELDIIAKLRHPYVIHVYDVVFNIDSSRCFIFMRHAERGDLLDYVFERDGIDERQTKIWLRQMCLAVQYLHTLNIAHRDLKCENALLTFSYSIKIADFGFSRSTVDDNNRAVRSDTFCGSMNYAAPEILCGISYYPKYVDIWALGVILFIMLNNSMPFEQQNVRKLIKMQVNRGWKLKTCVASKISSELKVLLSQMMEPVISKRLSIDEVLSSSWIQNDPTLKHLNDVEQDALNRARKDTDSKK